MMEPCGNQTEHAEHRYIAADSNGYYLCPGVKNARTSGPVTRMYQRARAAERQLAATVDELTEAQTDNARLAALVVESFDQRDAAQAAREQAEAQRDRALEQLAAVVRPEPWTVRPALKVPGACRYCHGYACPPDGCYNGEIR